MGIPPHVSAFARKRLGDAAGWDLNTEATASAVDWLQIIARGIAGMGGATPEGEFTPYPRPFNHSSLIASEPAPAVGLAEFADFLEGQD